MKLPFAATILLAVGSTILAADPLLQAQKYAGLKQGVENFFAEQRTDVN